MAEGFLTQPVAQSLVTSSAWRAYVAYLVDEFTKVEARYDHSCAPIDQGLKMGLRTAIEYPYYIAEHDSPLTRKATDMLKRHRRRQKPDEAPAPASSVETPVPRRSSGLV